jgi:hypothetical protein
VKREAEEVSLGSFLARCPVLGSVADDGLVARKQRLAPRPGALANWGSFPLDHRPWLEAVDEFASKSLTSRQRTNKRALATPTNKRMLLSQEKGRTPCNSIKSATFWPYARSATSHALPSVSASPRQQ